MERVRLRFARGVYVEFVDRELGLRWVEEWAERGTRFVQLVYGPEGCGKSAWLIQAAELLKWFGFDVIYINPVERVFLAEVEVPDVRRRFLELVREASEGVWSRVAWAALDLARDLIRGGRRRLAVLADDVFQAIGLEKAAVYVKGMLGLIEYPPGDYDVIVAVAATSEGVSLREIGRHRWADLRVMWNMSAEGFRQLYDRVPGEKPAFGNVWRLTGGNPSALAKLCEAGWDPSDVVEDVSARGRVTSSFVEKWRSWLERAVEDPDVLWSGDAPEGLIDELVERNLVIFHLPNRDSRLWIDAPPPAHDPEIGVGRRVAWQTPLHREAVKRALEAQAI
ncbi:ATP-binding protein [Pyrobaculum ferrireducens]|uniref:ATP-binding protein n=1 Tax=Pyrobaculum ferrireducens TaxID=1104324 RepID=UPI0011E583B3|nr:ATP-binding protein [Pyrobaculum ferrireducens]